MENKRIYVEKLEKFRTEKTNLLSEINENLKAGLKDLRVINVYDIFNISNDLLEVVKNQVFSEIVSDKVYDELDLSNKLYFAVEFLPGQFDQRADSAEQCISLIEPSSIVKVKSSKLYIFNSDLSLEVLEKIKTMIINPVETREKDLNILSLESNTNITPVPIFDGFINYSIEELLDFKQRKSLAMSLEDIKHIQNYFKNTEKRNPTETEILLLDTYWSDHCRHTTFEALIEDVDFESGEYCDALEDVFNTYKTMKLELKRSSDVSLMDMATICTRYLKSKGMLNDLEESEEVNACSVYIDVDVNGKTEKYLLMFKNETHNHPTEIEPFGGASTCVGGAIRDPLSGRSYVYQAVRISGSANPLQNIEDTIPGKLPQRTISKVSAKGYSSYGNQIGLSTSYVKEIFHKGYLAKHMEVGAVVGACPAENVVRKSPTPGDVVIMFGGRTGRDGIGGATGSSKEHDEKSVETASTEVQKGNAPEERKIQRLFRNPLATKLVKKSNDFGAGGVSVAIGELADGLDIYLDNVLTKYDGLNGTELAISESQERMSVVVEAKDADIFIDLCKSENIEAVKIADVTDTNRLIMHHNGIKIVDLSRDFIKTNGVRQNAKVAVKNKDIKNIYKREVNGDSFNQKFFNNLKDINVTSQKGLVQMFDSTIGANTVLMQYGGKNQLSESLCSISKIPVLDGETDTASAISYGFNPDISEQSPFIGAAVAVLDSITKIVASSGTYSQIRFSFQEYFEKLGEDKIKWGKPFEALLGTIYMQKGFELPAIGGKDSMSGTFKDINVPPTLISFAVTSTKASRVISQDLKKENNNLYIAKHRLLDNKLPNITQLKKLYDNYISLVNENKVSSSYSVGYGGISEAIAKMCFGNKLGVNIDTELDLFDYDYGSIIFETPETIDIEDFIYLGKVTSSDIVINNNSICFSDALHSYFETLSPIYPVTHKTTETVFSEPKLSNPKLNLNPEKTNNVNVFIPIFPGTNCEYDTTRAFRKAGANVVTMTFKNNTREDIIESINEMANHIKNSHIIALAGGFSAGDEPDGSGKFISNILNNNIIKNSINEHLSKDRLILGICNGFQALIKSGLLPFSKLGEISEDYPTLTLNNINNHLSIIAKTKVCKNNSPWLSSFTEGDVHHIPMSHGEGKFVVSKEMASTLYNNGQIAFQYVDDSNNPTYDPNYNINGSDYAIEGITSSCGKILGKMGHSERVNENTLKNIYGNKDQNIFKNAINYFKGV